MSIFLAVTWEQVKRPYSREITFLDNNVLACDFGLEQIKRMGRERGWVDFNQGLGARLITPDTAALLADLHWIRFVRMSCSTTLLNNAVELLRTRHKNGVCHFHNPAVSLEIRTGLLLFSFFSLEPDMGSISYCFDSLRTSGIACIQAKMLRTFCCCFRSVNDDMLNGSLQEFDIMAICAIED